MSDKFEYAKEDWDSRIYYAQPNESLDVLKVKNDLDTAEHRFLQWLNYRGNYGWELIKFEREDMREDGPYFSSLDGHRGFKIPMRWYLYKCLFKCRL